MNKTYLFSLLVWLFCGLSFTACNDQDYQEDNLGMDPLTLTAEQSTDALQEINHAANALTLNWTTGNNGGTGNRIYYTLQLAKAGTHFAEPYTALCQEGQTYSWSVNQENLNGIVLDQFGGVPGRKCDIEARVLTQTPGWEDTLSDSLSFSVTPYQPVTTTLYLIGDATPNGWNADNATVMERVDNGLFEWQGDLKIGSLKFITTKGQFLPSYNKGTDDRAVLRTGDNEPDEKWQIEESHYYKVEANLLTGDVTFTQAEGNRPAFDHLYLVGNMTDWGFETMSTDALDPYLFRTGKVFDKGGEFKFGTAKGSWENMYKATVDNAPYTDTHMQFVSGYDPDHKWFLKDGETGKAYKICVDIRKGKERMLMKPFTPYTTIWMVGDATPAGWSIDNATALQATDNPYIFTWTGTLNAGELKFTCDKRNDWNGAWFLCAAGNDKEPTGQTEKMLFIDKSDEELKNQYLDINVGDIDQKWKITQSGTYTITLNQLAETVSIVKQ